MPLMTNPALMGVRRLSRRLGLNRLAGKALSLRGYEASFWDTVSRSIRPGECVWDVGANIGYYTRRFSDLVGRAGAVVAFEPSPINHRRLLEAVAGCANVQPLELGLSNEPGQATLVQGADDIGATSHLGEVGDASQTRHVVELARGDDLVASGQTPFPTVLKIDVEGHELGVVSGLAGTLASGGVRHVFIEVHFALLEAQGLKDGAARLERMARDWGFRTRWLDPSHLHAFRDN